MSLWLQPLKKYADFSGRARRAEYWGFALFNFLVAMGFCLLLAILMLMGETGGMLAVAAGGLMILYSLYAFIPSLAVTFRRLHDIDRSAAWILIAFIPFAGAVILLIFYFLDGTYGPNRYGPDPKGREPLSGGTTVKEVHHHYYNAPAPASPTPPAGGNDPIVS